VEGALIMLPFLALVFLIVDTSYGIFIKATLQYAVQAGASYAAVDTAGGLLTGIRSTVSSQSLNLIAPSAVNVNFYAASDTSTPLTGAATPNQPGNIVEIDVSYSFAPLAPLFRSGAAIPLTASAASVLTTSPPPSL
jgi:Flp pilus assembly protein TadG